MNRFTNRFMFLDGTSSEMKISDDVTHYTPEEFAWFMHLLEGESMSHHYGHAQEAHESDTHYAARKLKARAKAAYEEQFGELCTTGALTDEVVHTWYTRREGRNFAERLMNRAHQTVHLEFLKEAFADLGLDVSLRW